ncbi:hypothetical protein GCM10011584_18460 [Nocardioides phosphati]|uniref:PH domain-containing protein n=1 Tax=Nocardioides phosphati TaxID=1867775 RepID=A0ABQ2NB45_9ACTN|nr:hypothetical protein [Nocardioides phosphati]GGO89320.1 hypothetical protein GCM10011584_18460 [Nocardioides phosphati]
MENQVNHARAALDVLTALQGGPVATPEAREVDAAAAPLEPQRAAKTRTAKVRAPKVRTPKVRAPREARAPQVRTPKERTPRAPKAARAVAAPEPLPAVPAPAASASDDLERIETRPRRLARRVTGLLLLLSLAATATTAWAAWTVRDTTLGGVALILGALTAGLWFLRVVSVTTTVSLLGPRLEVTQAGQRRVWDLASPYSPVDHVRGRPGRPGWRVVLRNADGSTFAIDGTMVPAKRFTEILSRYRPEL